MTAPGRRSTGKKRHPWLGLQSGLDDIERGHCGSCEHGDGGETGKRTRECGHRRARCGRYEFCVEGVHDDEQSVRQNPGKVGELIFPTTLKEPDCTTTMSSSTLPAPSQQANKTALAAALAENPLASTHDPDTEPGEIQEVDMHAQAEGIRTVFSDPTNFNVKVSLSLCASHRANPLRYKHPLFSPWTLWFDSPATKGRNLPQTPISSFPQTPVLQTQSAAAAQGWMEDIKRVISFDSVEEFWG